MQVPEVGSEDSFFSSKRRCLGSDVQPLARVMFFNSENSLRIQRRLEEVLRDQTTCTDREAGDPQQGPTEQISIQQQETELDSLQEPEDVDVPRGSVDPQKEENGPQQGAPDLEQSLQASDDDCPSYIEYYKEFCLDWLGVPAQENLMDAFEVIYSQVYTGVFWIDEFAAREECRLRRMAIKCFNCGDDHHLRDCPEPKDWSRITAQISVYKDSLPTKGADVRYHSPSSLANERFSKFTPGKISMKLRKALGLSKTTDLPPYIERMKSLGYPPGYRLADQETSLALFDSFIDDVEAATTCENADKVSSDPVTQEIAYPGFNTAAVTKLELSTQGLPRAKKVKLPDIDAELGTLSDYEFEEEEDGVAFGLKKLLQSPPVKQEEEPDKTEETDELVEEAAEKKDNNFSLDFPPGLVHLDKDSESSNSGRWSAIKNLISSTRTKRSV